MASILAIVSRKVFERDFRVGGASATVGDTVATDGYLSTHASLTKLAAGGDLFLVTVAPGERLWLAGVLASPKLGKDRWSATPNTTPITDITHLIGKLSFENGKGITAKAGALAMSLQTPRTLADDDVELLRGCAPSSGKKPAKQQSAKNKPAPKSKPTPKPSPKSKPTPKPSKASTAGGGLIVSTARGNELAQVQAQLASGAYAGALDSLLRAWERCKAAAIADLIDELGAWLASALPPITGKKSELDGLWRDVGDATRPVDVPRLAVALDLGSANQLEAWLEILDRFPLDPRLCAPVIAISTKFVASTAGPTRTRAFRLAEKIADGRCIPQIQKLIAKRSDAWNANELRDRVRKMLAKFAPPPALPAADKTIVAALGKQIGKLAKQPPPDDKALARKTTGANHAGEQLLAQVLADPTNDGPRVVYADYLQEVGDSRGELITLQLLAERTPEQQARLDTLLKNKANLVRWLGPLAAVVTEPVLDRGALAAAVTQPVFERGFLHAARVKLVTPKHRSELVHHPLWATVEEVWTNDLPLIESPALSSLRRVVGLTIDEALTLASRTTPSRLEGLIRMPFEPRDDDEKWPQLGQVGSLTNVKELGLLVGYSTIDARGTGLDAFAWLVKSKLGKQLVRLSVDFGANDSIPQIADWLSIFKTLPKLTELVIGLDDPHNLPLVRLQVCAAREKSTLRLVLEVGPVFFDASDQYLRRDLENLPRLFEGFPLKHVPALEIQITSKITVKQRTAVLEQLQHALATRFDTITVSPR
jgi:uncharacterized protein (TIGR02996 family)